MRIGSLRLNAEPRKRILRVLSVLLALLLMGYCFYHFTTVFDSEIQTMLVTEDTVETCFSGEAVLFRDEVAVESVYSGLTVPLVSAGEHVAKDTEIVSVYPSGAENRETFRLLTSYLEKLYAAEYENDALADLAQLRSELEMLLSTVIAELERGDAAASAETVEEIRVLSCRVQALTDASFSLDELISALETERGNLLSSAGSVSETLKAEQSGYYYPDADASFALCSPDRIGTLTGAELSSIADALRSADTSPYGAGTLVRSAEWYIAVQTELTAEDLASLAVGGSYPVIFSDGGTEIPMTLVRTVEKTAEDPAVLIFSTLRMPSGFSFDRLQNVRIVTGSMNGYSVPESAVHTLDGAKGVYVLEGNVMYFCRIEIMHDLGVRYLVKTTDPTPGGEYTENTYRYIALYDAMIVSGGSLFHGRVLS